MTVNASLPLSSLPVPSGVFECSVGVGLHSFARVDGLVVEAQVLDSCPGSAPENVSCPCLERGGQVSPRACCTGRRELKSSHGECYS